MCVSVCNVWSWQIMVWSWWSWFDRSDHCTARWLSFNLFIHECTTVTGLFMLRHKIWTNKNRDHSYTNSIFVFFKSFIALTKSILTMPTCLCCFFSPKLFNEKLATPWYIIITYIYYYGFDRFTGFTWLLMMEPHRAAAGAVKGAPDEMLSELPPLRPEQYKALQRQGSRLVPEARAAMAIKDSARHWDIFYKRNGDRWEY